MNKVKENKVGYNYQKGAKGQERRVPKIQLQGVWLEKADFQHSDNIRVTTTKGKIVIEKI